MGDGLRLLLFQVSDALHRPVYELEEELPLRELLEYPIYWRWRNAEEKKQIEKAKLEAARKEAVKSWRCRSAPSTCP
jgi:hypothetical protein